MNIGYHLALRTGRLRRNIQTRRPRAGMPHLELTSRTLRVLSFSDARDFPEQRASIESFLRHAGVPTQWTVATPEQRVEQHAAPLEALHDAVRVLPWDDLVARSMPTWLEAFANYSAYGKKLAVITCGELDGPTLYVDSDVRFFAGAARGLHELSGAQRPRYLADCVPFVKENLLGDATRRAEPVNSGVAVIPPGMNWEPAFEVLDRARTTTPIPWVEQTAIHAALHEAGATRLDPDRYVMRIDDQFALWDKHVNQATVLRHYVGSIRHKFWFHPSPPRVARRRAV